MTLQGNLRGKEKVASLADEVALAGTAAALRDLHARRN